MIVPQTRYTRNVHPVLQSSKRFQPCTRDCDCSIDAFPTRRLAGTCDESANSRVSLLVTRYLVPVVVPGRESRGSLSRFVYRRCSFASLLSVVSLCCTCPRLPLFRFLLESFAVPCHLILRHFPRPLDPYTSPPARGNLLSILFRFLRVRATLFHPLLLLFLFYFFPSAVHAIPGKR